MITKKELRKIVSNKKNENTIADKIGTSRAIFSQIEQMQVFQESQNILCYWSMSDEVCTHDFVIETAAKKRVFLPVVSGDNLLLKKFNGVDNLKEGESFSVLEPDHSECVGIDDMDLVVVPGVAFDLRGGRMGRGKGYYDKLLAGARAYKIGVCFDFQLVDRVPTEVHDVLMDEIIFNNKMISADTSSLPLKNADGEILEGSPMHKKSDSKNRETKL